MTTLSVPTLAEETEMASSNTRRLRLPYIAVQPSLPHVVSDILAPGSTIAVEDCWVSCYAPDPAAAPAVEMKSVHGKVRLTESDEKEGEVECLPKDDRVRVDMLSPSELDVACPELSIPSTTVLFPSADCNTLLRPTTSTTSSSSAINPTTQELPPPSFYRLPAPGRRAAIETFAQSVDSRRIVVGGVDGLASVVELVEQVVVKSSASRRTRVVKGKETALRGHVGDLTDAAFFPSSEVILTASSDMTLRVFSALDGSSPRTLKGHTKRVTSTHILASPTPEGPHKGRLVLSSSLDGTIRLWDVSTSNNERTWTLQHPISEMVVVGKEGEDEGDEGSEASDVLRGKVALAAHTDGTVSIVDLSEPAATTSTSIEAARVVLRTSSTSPIDAISTLGGGWVVTGSRNGVVSLFRLSGLEGENLAAEAAAPVVSWSRTEGGSSILDVKLSKRLRTSVAPPTAPAPDADTEMSTAAAAAAAATFSVLVTPSDGLAYRAVVDVSPTSKSSDSDWPCEVRVVEEFVGPDCEPTTCIREDKQGRVWISAGGTDGGLRVYERAV